MMYPAENKVNKVKNTNHNHSTKVCYWGNKVL
jgi:hypothetical protein